MEKERNIGIILALVIVLLIAAFMIISLLNKPVYKVTFNTVGGSNIESIQVKSKEKIKEPQVPIKEGYTFIGWTLEDKDFDFNSEITKNITLVAKWQKIDIETVTLKFDSLDGSKIEDINIKVGSILEMVPNPSKEDYLFLYWTYQNKEYNFQNPITKDMTFVAKYKKDTTKKYTVSFDALNNSEIITISVKENETVAKIKDPIKEGYTFIGWTLEDKEFDFKTKITKDITLIAKWEENKEVD